MVFLVLQIRQKHIVVLHLLDEINRSVSYSHTHIHTLLFTRTQTHILVQTVSQPAKREPDTQTDFGSYFSLYKLYQPVNRTQQFQSFFFLSLIFVCPFVCYCRFCCRRCMSDVDVVVVVGLVVSIASKIQTLTHSLTLPNVYIVLRKNPKRKRGSVLFTCNL